jgi:hypothetical protein
MVGKKRAFRDNNDESANDKVRVRVRVRFISCIGLGLGLGLIK